MSTLASSLKDPVTRQKYIDANIDANKITSYVFLHDEVQPEIVCSTCELSIGSSSVTTKVNKEQLDGSKYLVWCIACDRLYHLACAKLKELFNSHAPWLCTECVSNPANEAATSLVSSGRANDSLLKRLSAVKLVTSDSDNEDEVTSYFEKSLHVDIINGQPKLRQIKERFETQTTEATKLGNALKAARDTIKELRAELQNKEEEIKLLTVNVKRRNEDDHSSGSKSNRNNTRIPGVTYADDFDTEANPFAHSSTSTHSCPKMHSTCTHSAPQKDPDTAMAIHKLGINQMRNALPLVKEFNGSPEKWLTFERSVEVVRSEGCYDDRFMKHIIRDKLTGFAYNLVDKLFDTHSFEQIMGRLRSAFGNPQIVVDAARADVQKMQIPHTLTQAVVLEASTVISKYIEACKQAKIDPHDRTLAIALTKQLDARYAEGYYAYHKQFHPHKTIEANLEVLCDYFEHIRETLVLGSFKAIESNKPKNKNFQLSAISTPNNNSQPPANQSPAGTPKPAPKQTRLENFEMRDVKEARFQGYYLDKVKAIPTFCYLCNSNAHYTIECKNYKKKSVAERQRFVDSKQLCASCVIARDHTPSNCTLKKLCGARFNNVRCVGKHHVSLHTKGNSKTSRDNQNSAPRTEKPTSSGETNSNAPQDDDTFQGFPVASTRGGNRLIQATLERDGFQVLSLSTKVSSSPRTIKLFRTFVSYNGQRAATFTVGDSAAEISLVKRSLVDALGISGPPCTIGIQWTDDSYRNITGIKVSLPIKGILPNSKEFVITDCYAIEDFNLPPRSLNVQEIKRKHPYLRSIPFDSYTNASPAILLGSRHAALVEAIAPIWEDGEGKPIGVLTKLGYSIYGVDSGKIEPHDVLNAISTTPAHSFSQETDFVTNEELSRQLEYSNSIDSLHLRPFSTQFTADEKSALAQAESGIVKLRSGFVQMPLIWRLVDGKRPTLPDNFAMVFRRQIAQENKLKKTPEMLEAFNNNFKMLITEGYVRAATESDMHTSHNINYVPMSLVVNANKRPIKTRNVYDASAKYKGTSLNANLLAGPNLLIDLLKPLMSMRENAIAFTGDIKAMFNRICIDPVDQNAQRILWRFNPNQPMQVYIHLAMMFGPSCSPFVSQFVKNWAAKQLSQRYPETSESIEKDSYMDDWLTSVATVDEAILRIKEGIEIFSSINMHLVGIQSNNPSVLSAIPESHIKKELIPLLTGIEIQCVSKVLGVNWDIVSDNIIFEINEKLLDDKYRLTGVKPTKREQCSLIARIFDVIGLLAHCVIRARILLQHSWKKQVDWDQEIADDDALLWSEWLSDIKKAATVKIPRRRSTLSRFSDADNIELHVFCDAGQEAIAAVAYFVVVHNGRRESSFIMAKAKVAPLKLKSKKEIPEMPRLEVLGALIASRLASHIKQLHSHISFSSYFWCDSEVVLRWIWNTNLKLPKFAISPIGEILESTEIHQWKYVESKLNVADLATKFQSHEFGNSQSVWFTGPEFIRLEPDYWPNQRFSESNREAAIVCNHQLVSQDIASNEVVENPSDFLPQRLPPFDCKLLSLFDKETSISHPSAIMNLLRKRKPSIFSSWSKLVRATARMLIVRNEIFIPLLKSRKWRRRNTKREIIATSQIKQTLNPEYIELAELFLVRYMQHLKWQSEIIALKKGNRTNNKDFLKLHVFLDKDNIIRIRSRVSLPYADYPQKFAPLIPHLNEKDSLSEIMLFHFHYMFRHVCIESQIAEFRSKYWMVALRERLKSVGHRCNLCKIRRAHSKTPLMADLPQFRVDRRLQPFEVTGLDVCGPFFVSINKKPKKIWILLFTCTVTRFVTLQILDKMDTETTLAKITKTYADHGPIARLISDNGTNFVGASNILHREQERALKELRNSQNYVNEHFVNQLKPFRWDFLPPKAAWFGGFYERLIGELKRGMREEIHSKGISLSAFEIAMHETAHRLNCRPLTHLPVSHEDQELLTPHHLAKNRSGWPTLPSAHTLKESGKSIVDRSYYIEGQKLADKITRRFYKHYLSELTQRTKWDRKQTQLEVGNLVLIIDPNVTRAPWQRGIIHSFAPSRDGIHRVAEVKTSDGSIKKRAIQHLSLIKIENA